MASWLSSMSTVVSESVNAVWNYVSPPEITEQRIVQKQGTIDQVVEVIFKGIQINSFDLREGAPSSDGDYCPDEKYNLAIRAFRLHRLLHTENGFADFPDYCGADEDDPALYCKLYASGRGRTHEGCQRQEFLIISETMRRALKLLYANHASREEVFARVYKDVTTLFDSMPSHWIDSPSYQVLKSEYEQSEKLFLGNLKKIEALFDRDSDAINPKSKPIPLPIEDPRLSVGDQKIPFIMEMSTWFCAENPPGIYYAVAVSKKECQFRGTVKFCCKRATHTLFIEKIKTESSDSEHRSSAEMIIYLLAQAILLRLGREYCVKLADIGAFPYDSTPQMSRLCGFLPVQHCSLEQTHRWELSYQTVVSEKKEKIEFFSRLHPEAQLV